VTVVVDGYYPAYGRGRWRRTVQRLVQDLFRDAHSRRRVLPAIWLRVDVDPESDSMDSAGGRKKTATAPAARQMRRSDWVRDEIQPQELRSIVWGAPQVDAPFTNF